MRQSVITAWVAVLLRSMKTRQLALSLDGTSHLFIVLDKATLFVAAARNARRAKHSYAILVWGRYDETSLDDTGKSETQRSWIVLCDMGMGKIWWGRIVRDIWWEE